MSSYKPTLGNSYAEWTPSDKVASYGALGVLGVKYGKAATAGLLAVAMVVLKKAWFLLLAPFIGLKRLFSSKQRHRYHDGTGLRGRQPSAADGTVVIAPAQLGSTGACRKKPSVRARRDEQNRWHAASEY